MEKETFKIMESMFKKMKDYQVNLRMKHLYIFYHIFITIWKLIITKGSSKNSPIILYKHVTTLYSDKQIPQSLNRGLMC